MTDVQKTDVEKLDVQKIGAQNAVAQISDAATTGETTAAYAEWVKKKRHGSPAHLAAFKRRMAIVRAMQKDTLPEDEPADIDTLRDRISRMICIYIDDSEGCPERLCRRYRGCMAPNNTCANAEKRERPPVSPEKFARFVSQFKRSMADAMAKAEAAGAGGDYPHAQNRPSTTRGKRVKAARHQNCRSNFCS